MVEIKGYKTIDYITFQTTLQRTKVDKEISNPQLAVCAGLKDTATVKKCFTTKKQVVKDTVITKIMECLAINGFILWVNGNRYYYIKK